MEGEKYRKGKGKQPGKAEKSDKITIEGAMAEEQDESNGGQGENEKLTATDMEDNVAVIRADIKMMAMDMKSELNNFRDRFRDDFKRELAET